MCCHFTLKGVSTHGMFCTGTFSHAPLGQLDGCAEMGMEGGAVGKLGTRPGPGRHALASVPPVRGNRWEKVGSQLGARAMLFVVCLRNNPTI